MKTLLLVLAVVGFSLQPLLAQNTVVKQVPVRSTSTMEGPELYAEYCAVCHGKDGKGGGPAAVALKQQPADLTQLARKHSGKLDELRVLNVITGEDVVAAHGSRDMPTWGAVFASMSTNESTRKLRVNSLLRYVQSLQVK